MGKFLSILEHIGFAVAILAVVTFFLRGLLKRK
jgi:hypothetical protein